MNDIPVLVTAAQQWEFVDEKTGEKRSGVSVHLIPLDQPKDERVIGTKPVKYTLNADAIGLFYGKELPAFCFMDSQFNFNSGKMVPVNFKAFAPFDYKDYLAV